MAAFPYIPDKGAAAAAAVPFADQPLDRCPTCGHQFEPVADVNACPVCGDRTPREQLIREDDDYLWTM